MRLQSGIIEIGQNRIENVRYQKLLLARRHMGEALTLLDTYSRSAAAASVDLAMHQLDRELDEG